MEEFINEVVEEGTHIFDMIPVHVCYLEKEHSPLTLVEVAGYLDYLKDKYKDRELSSVVITVDGEDVNLETHFKSIPFERIRRITGYLVGTLDRFNDAKRAEVEARVKHMTKFSVESQEHKYDSELGKWGK